MYQLMWRYYFLLKLLVRLQQAGLFLRRFQIELGYPIGYKTLAYLTHSFHLLVAIVGLLLVVPILFASILPLFANRCPSN